MSGHVHQPYGHQTQSSVPNRNGLLTAGTVLLFVSGGLGILGSLFFIFFSYFYINMISYNDQTIPQGLSIISTIYLVIGIVMLLLAVLAIFSGFKTRKRTSYKWALTGGICALLCGGGVVGILCLVFIAMSKNEFNAQTQ